MDVAGVDSTAHCPAWASACRSNHCRVGARTYCKALNHNSSSTALHQIAAEYPDSMYFPLRTTLGTLDELMGRQSSPESAGDCAAAKAKVEALLARVSTDVMQAFVHSLEECVVALSESTRPDSVYLQFVRALLANQGYG